MLLPTMTKGKSGGMAQKNKFLIPYREGNPEEGLKIDDKRGGTSSCKKLRSPGSYTARTQRTKDKNPTRKQLSKGTLANHGGVLSVRKQERGDGCQREKESGRPNASVCMKGEGPGSTGTEIKWWGSRGLCGLGKPPGDTEKDHFSDRGNLGSKG